MTDKHTPGPWEMPAGPADKNISDIFDVGDYNVYPPLGEAGPVAIVAGEANAHLIAAAPTLYDAAHNAAGVLIACCKPAGGCDDDHAIHDAIKRLEDAIAKARGEA